MPIPNLNEHGFLPEGVHDCTIDEVGARFGRFQVSDRRVRLFERLCALIEEEQQAALAVELIIDGSFVTAEPTPNDIDLVVVLPQGYNYSLPQPPFRYNAVSRLRLQRRYGFDIFVVEAGSFEFDRQVTYFQQVKGRPDRQKGLLKINFKETAREKLY